MGKVALLPDDASVWREFWLAGLLWEQATEYGEAPANTLQHLSPDLFTRDPHFNLNRIEKLRHTNRHWRIGPLLEE